MIMGFIGGTLISIVFAIVVMVVIYSMDPEDGLLSAFRWSFGATGLIYFFIVSFLFITIIFF